MAKKATYQDYLKQEMSELIDQIDLSPLQKRFMKGRWLDQVLWLEGRANKARNRHHTLRMITIIGGVIVPALVSVNSANVTQNRLKHFFGWTAFGLSQAVAISAAIEELFHFGENYRRYRNTAENMKIQGWYFFQLSGPYKDANSHAEAYTTFSNNVENIIQQDVEGYISQAVKSQEESKASTNQTTLQNLTLVNKQLREQVQKLAVPHATDFPIASTPLPKDSTLQNSEPSEPVILPNANEETIGGS